MPPNRLDSSGFTLIEVMVALSLLAMGMAGAAKLTQSGYQHLTATEQYRQAAYWAHSHLNTLSTAQNKDFKYQSGHYDEHFRWELNFSPVETAALDASVVGLSTVNETGWIKEISPRVNAQRADLLVRFDSDQRSLNFHTLIFSLPTGQPPTSGEVVQ